jgi:UDP-N-acetylglucosamine--N-acetylmuramyl-(pentapeptide) pyrophosphoryl-undecaprenol N-acetylglucosamine transferase
MSNLKIVISGGGTGGHIYPAIAIAKKYLKRIKIQKYYLLVLKEEWKWKKFLKKDLALLG